ncbi:hypothetical protein EXIGLDRAFT_719768 [Exidia glandulosa HHB12029]|uniref:Uncharacterized protein n=1 Tax=Exidia glandulosa HHB12029 TaxID=1314781 RepID=A0A165GUS7_EXIGL|nr:hypothetical protein EXIGLDRAFT_719768 [Exidia glandulosa HHB12029]
MTPTTIKLVARAWLFATFVAQLYAIYVTSAYHFTTSWAVNYFLLSLPVTGLVLLVNVTRARFAYAYDSPELYQFSVRFWPIMSVFLCVWWTVCAFVMLADSIKSCPDDNTGVWRVVRWICEETQDRHILMLANIVACPLFGVFALAVKGVTEQTPTSTSDGEAKDEEKFSASSMSEIV